MEVVITTDWACACGWRGDIRTAPVNPSGIRVCPVGCGSGGLILGSEADRLERRLPARALDLGMMSDRDLGDLGVRHALALDWRFGPVDTELARRGLRLLCDGENWWLVPLAGRAPW